MKPAANKPPMKANDPPRPPAVAEAPDIRTHLRKAIAARRDLIERLRGSSPSAEGPAFRVFSGGADGAEGIFIDIYGPGAVLIEYEGRTPKWAIINRDFAAKILEVLKPLGVTAIYRKPFARDRTKMGGDLPAIALSAKPAAGEALPEAITIRELAWKLEVQLYTGLSTGLFLDQRDNRAYVARWVKARSAGRPPAVLNTFAYTCAFSVAAAMAGAATTSVDISPKYLDWGKRNFALNGIDPEAHRFAKMDTFEFFAYAKRKELTYDFLIIDPPSFASGSKKKGIRPFSSTADFGRLIREAASLMNPRGVIFASTNTQELCLPGRLDREITKGLGKPPRWIRLPAPPEDFARERERFAARAFEV